jgi:hypothetical protein
MADRLVGELLSGMPAFYLIRAWGTGRRADEISEFRLPFSTLIDEI